MFISTPNLDFMHLDEHKILDFNVWVFHEKYKGMQDYAKKFPEYKEETNVADYKQPHTKIHLQFVKDIICPKIPIISTPINSPMSDE